MPTYAITPPDRTTLPIAGSQDVFPVSRVFCIGRNYADHAIEMGHDPTREDPFFFQKSPDCLTTDGHFPYPTVSSDVHHEIELAVALTSGGTNIAEDEALSHVWGHAVALDMTRRDLQGIAKKAGRPWEIGKSFPAAAPIGPLVPAAGAMAEGHIELAVNGTVRQSGNLNQMIWKIPEIIAYLSDYYDLQAGDVILTGTPAGVGPVVPGDRLIGRIDGLPELKVTVD